MQHRLSSLQLATLDMAPREWTVLEGMNAWSNALGTLVSRGLIERKRVGDAVLWRRRPLTFRQAVDRLLMRLPTNTSTLERMGLLDEVQELRRVIAQLPPENVGPSEGTPRYTGEYSEEDVHEAQRLMGLA